MSEKSKIVAETEAYLAKIRKTVRESRNLVESARLRMAETDRMLESAGTTREEVMKFSFSASQKDAVNDELERMGFERLENEDDLGFGGEYREMTPGVGFADGMVQVRACTAGANFSAGDGDGSTENRKRKFNVMMQQFRM